MSKKKEDILTAGAAYFNKPTEPAPIQEKASRTKANHADEQPEEWQTVCVRVRSDLYKKAEIIVMKEKIRGNKKAYIKDIIADGMKMAIEAYEKKYGKLDI